MLTSTFATAVHRSIDVRFCIDDALLAQLNAQFDATAAEHDRAGRFPHDNYTVLQRHALVGLTVPIVYGGLPGAARHARHPVIESRDRLGLRASGSHEVMFEAVKIPLDYAVDVRAPETWIPGNGRASDIEAYAQQQAWMVVLLGSLYDAVARRRGLPN